MRRLIHLILALVLAVVLTARAARAAEGASVQALLIIAAKGKGGSDPRLAEYEATLKRTLRFDTFKLAGQGSAAVSGGNSNASINLGGGHRVQIGGGDRAGAGIRVRVTWTNGSREMMNTSLTLQPGIPAVLGSGGDGEVPVVLVIAR
jgi:hypothetical protein